MNTPVCYDNDRCLLRCILQSARSLTSRPTLPTLARSNEEKVAGPTPPGPTSRVTATAKKLQIQFLFSWFRFAETDPLHEENS
jgi:hypothetical protein